MRKNIIGLTIVLALCFGMSNMGVLNVTAYDTSITVTGAKVAIDIFHGSYSHTDGAITDLDSIVGNLTAAGNEVVLINNTWVLEDDVTALFIPEARIAYNATEMADIKAWLELGDKFLFVTGNSDYVQAVEGEFPAVVTNDLLEYLGAKTRLSPISVSDPDYYDGATYRTACVIHGDNDMADKLMAGVPVDVGMIIHSPCSIIGVEADGTTPVDIRTTDIVGVDIILQFGENSSAQDTDVSDTPFDLIYTNATEIGDFPGIVYENLTAYDSHMIIAGEVIFSNYKRMYDQKTEKGEYNDGLTYGAMIIDNIVNEFVKPVVSDDAPFGFAFAILSIAIIGTIYAIIRRRR